MSTFYGFTHGMRPRMTVYCLVGILFTLAFHEPTISSSLPTRSSARVLNVDSLVSFWWSTSRPVDLHDTSLRDSWNWNRSMEKTHSSSSAKLTGKYAPIREILDYSYHRKYSQHRQKLQDDIIDSLMNRTEVIDTQGCHCARPQVPWVVFTAGAMGAGKSHVIKTLGERGYFPLNGFMIVDPDQIRRQLPEFLYYTQQYPEQAGALTRKEAGLIAEIAIEAGLERGYNIMVDGSLSNATWYERYIPNLRKQHPDLQVAILHVSAPREIVLERASNRAKATGRVVPQDLLETALEIVPKSVARLAPLVDFCAEIENPGTGDISLLSPQGWTWNSFRHQWDQRCSS